MTVSYEAIGHLSSPFKEKFGVPRQSLLLSEAKGWVKLRPDPLFQQAARHLDQFSHIWLIFVFHKNMHKPWHPLIDTPLLEAGEKMGVFATRSPDRPNSIGMSAVKLERIDLDAPQGIEIHVSGLDLLDGTPILDIKPYLPYADRIEDANSGWVTQSARRYPVSFSEESLATLEEAQEQLELNLRELIREMLELDPRPTSQRRAAPLNLPSSEGLRFAFRLMNMDIQWEARQGGLHVLAVKILQA